MEILWILVAFVFMVVAGFLSALTIHTLKIFYDEYYYKKQVETEVKNADNSKRI